MTPLANIERVLLAVAEQEGGLIENDTKIKVAGCTAGEVANHIRTLHAEGMVTVKQPINTFQGVALLGISVTTKGLDKARQLRPTNKGDKVMRVFLIWSGDASRALASALHDWLPSALPSVEPWMSEEDIAKGSREDAEMAKVLGKTPYGIVCVTPGVQYEPWVNFEAGGISTKPESHVSPLLLGVTSDELSKLPLKRFQCTEINKKEDVAKLLRSLNRASESHISDKALERNLRNTWPGLRTRIQKIPLTPTPAAKPDAPSRNDDELHAIERAILVMLAKHNDRLAVESIFAAIAEHNVRIQHHLDVLEQQNMVQPDAWAVLDVTTDLNLTTYHLTPKGRAYVVKHDLIP